MWRLMPALIPISGTYRFCISMRASITSISTFIISPRISANISGVISVKSPSTCSGPDRGAGIGLCPQWGHALYVRSYIAVHSGHALTGITSVGFAFARLSRRSSVQLRLASGKP